MHKHGSRRIAALALLCPLACGSPAAAQSASSYANAAAASGGAAAPAIVAAPPPNPGHLDLTPAPVFGSAGDPFGVTTVTGPTAAGSAPPSALSNLAYSFADYARTVHGVVSAGVSSTGGYGFSGLAELPLVPGRAELDVGVTQGNTGNFQVYPGSRKYSATYTGYDVGLHLHPADNFDAYIGVSGLRFAQPQQQP